MSEQSHTPGPWKVYHTTDGRTMLGVGDAEGGGITDANMCLGTWRAGLEQAANARLIAAAPELLSALEGMVNDWEAHGGSYITAARAAISKATGAA